MKCRLMTLKGLVKYIMAINGDFKAVNEYGLGANINEILSQGTYLKIFNFINL